MERSVAAPTAVALLLLFQTVINDSRGLAAAPARRSAGTKDGNGGGDTADLDESREERL